MNHQGHSMKGHLLHMLIAGAAVLGILLLSGVDLAKAAPYAIALACPLGMVAMMWMMNRGQGNNHQHHEQQPTSYTAPDADGQREAPRDHGRVG